MASAPTEEESSRAEQSVQAFRDALEKSITISRERLQEVVGRKVVIQAGGPEIARDEYAISARGA